MFEADPGNEGGAEGEVEEPFIGDGEDYEGWRECETNDDEAVKVMVVWTKFVDKEKGQRGYQCQPSDNLTAQRKALLGLKGGDAGARDNDGEQDESDLNAHDRARDVI